MSAVYVVGSGPSSSGVDFSAIEDHICAVSSGINVLGDRVPEHFVAMDHPDHFNADLFSSSTVCKHVVQAEWRHYLNLKLYEIRQNCAMPYFTRGPVADGDLGIRFRQRADLGQLMIAMGINPVGALTMYGRGIFNNSLLMAVQVMPRMGYDQLVFIGCDLQEPQLHPVADILRAWYPIAQRYEIEWFHASPGSRLASFLPELEVLV